jgi:hypothetical protein
MSASDRRRAVPLVVSLTAFVLGVAMAAEAATVIRGPYLQMGSHNKIVVRWRTDVATNSSVSYGLCQGKSSCLTWVAVNSTVTTEHEVTLTGLSANTRYYYAVGTTTEILEGNDASHFFLTAPRVGASKSTRIWVLGDSGTANASARAVRDAYYKFTGSRHTDLWLMLGDNAYQSGTDAEFQAAVFDMYPDMLRKSVLWPTLGNHDGGSANSSTQSGPYYDIFTLPKKAEAGGVASGTEAYYSFDYGNVHFIVLDSFESSRSPTGAMMRWLREDLQATDQDWIIAYWHHPPYSKGSHDSDGGGALADMRRNALPILEDYGVDLVLSGHSHSYERSFLLDGHYGTSGTLVSSMILNSGDGRPSGDGAYEKPSLGPDPHRGTVYTVAGSSGKTSGGSLDHPVMFVSLSVLGSLVLNVDRNRLDATFLQSTGAVRDTFTILKGSSSGDIDVLPNSYTFGAVPVGANELRTFAIRNAGGASLKVSSTNLVGNDADEFAITKGGGSFTLSAGSTRNLDVRFEPTSGGAKTTTLRLKSNDPNESTFDVPLDGTGTASADIDVAPRPHNYGEVLVGTTASRTFAIRNVGSGRLAVTVTGLEGGQTDEFAITKGSAPFTVEPGATHSLDVRFSPTSGGTKTTTLRLTSDDPDESPLDVALSGTATTAPDIDLVATSHNFGDVLVGATASRTFGIRNVGSANLQVTAATLVGGVAGEFAIARGGAPFTIAPGATHNLDVRFAPISGGPKTTTLRVTSDDADESTVDLVLSGVATTAPDVEVLPALQGYGDVLVSTTASRTVAIRNVGSANLHVTTTSLVGGVPGEFAITSGGAPFTIAPGATHNLEVRFAPTSGGPKTTTLRVTSDDADEGTVDVALTGNATTAPEIDLSPTSHEYGEVLVGTVASWTFLIRNLGSADLQVTVSLVGSEASQFVLAQGTPFTVAPGATHNLDVRFAPTTAGPKHAMLHFTSNDQDEASLDVAVSGTGTAMPDIDLTPTAHDYGGVPVGATVSRTLTIRNTGSADLQVMTTSLVGGEASEFVIAHGAPFTVGPGASHDLDVRFAPTSLGPKTTTLRLTSDDQDEPTVDVVVNGTGITPRDLDVVPNAHDYDTVLIGTTASRTFAIRNAGTADLLVTAATLIGGETSEFAITQGAPFSLAPGVTHHVDVRFAPTSGGIKTTTLRFTTTDQDEGTVDVVVRGTGIVPPDIDLVLLPHDYGEVLVGMAASQTFAIRNVGGADLQVTAINLVGGEAGEFAVTDGGGPFDIAPGATHHLEVRFAPTSGGLKTTTLRLMSNDPDESSVDMVLRGTGNVFVPDVAVTPATHDYGAHPIGTSVTQHFTVSNTGTGNLIVGGATLTGDDTGAFAVVSGHAGLVVAPGASHLVEVRFSPLTAGPQHATLVIPSDDPDENPFLIPLSGSTPPTLEEVNQGGATASSTVTTDSSLTGVDGHFYLAAVSTKPYLSVSSMTGLGLTWTRLAAQCGGRSQTGIDLWWAQGNATTDVVTATLESAPSNAVIVAARYSGVAAANPAALLVAANTNGANGGCANGSDAAAYSFNVTPTGTKTLVVGAVALRHKTHTPESGSTTRIEGSQGSGGDIAGIALVDQIVPIATSLTLNGSFNGAVDWAVISVELHPD